MAATDILKRIPYYFIRICAKLLSYTSHARYKRKLLHRTSRSSDKPLWAIVPPFELQVMEANTWMVLLYTYVHKQAPYLSFKSHLKLSRHHCRDTADSFRDRCSWQIPLRIGKWTDVLCCPLEKYCTTPRCIQSKMRRNIGIISFGHWLNSVKTPIGILPVP